MKGEMSASGSSAPSSAGEMLGGTPMLDVLSFAGLTLALVAAALLLFLNREERPSAPERVILR